MDAIDQRDEILKTFLEYGIRENEVDGLRKTDLVECAEAIVKKMSVMRCCKSDSELLASKEKQKNMIIKMMRKDEESGMYSDNES